MKLTSKRNIYKIKYLIGSGIICFINLRNKKHYLFAWQIYNNPNFFNNFSYAEQVYIKKVAEYELKDPWYQFAGKNIQDKGIEAL